MYFLTVFFVPAKFHVTEGICNFIIMIIMRLDIDGEACPSQYSTWIKNYEELMRGVNICMFCDVMFLIKLFLKFSYAILCMTSKLVHFDGWMSFLLELSLIRLFDF